MAEKVFREKNKLCGKSLLQFFIFIILQSIWSRRDTMYRVSWQGQVAFSIGLPHKNCIIIKTQLYLAIPQHYIQWVWSLLMSHLEQLGDDGQALWVADVDRIVSVGLLLVADVSQVEDRWQQGEDPEDEEEKRHLLLRHFPCLWAVKLLSYWVCFTSLEFSFSAQGFFIRTPCRVTSCGISATRCLFISVKTLYLIKYLSIRVYSVQNRMQVILTISDSSRAKNMTIQKFLTYTFWNIQYKWL